MEVNDRVIISENSIIRNSFKLYKVYGIITKINKNSVDVVFLKKAYPILNNLYLNDLTLITQQDYELYETKEDIYINKYYTYTIPLKNKLLEKVIGNYKDKSYNINNNFNQTTRKVFVKVGKGGTIQETICQKDCCDFIKTGREYSYYIPEIYLNLYNYTAWDLNNWIQFLKKCNLEFNVTLEGKVKNDKRFYENNLGDDSKDEFKLSNTIIYITKNTNLFQINVPSSNYSWDSYLWIILLRYIHHESLHMIPRIAMQIKDALGDKITNFQALMIAHLFPFDRGGFNSIVDCSRWIDIFQDPIIAVKNIREQLKMNASFTYLNDGVYSKTTCQDLLKEKKYEEVFEILKKCKK